MGRLMALLIVGAAVTVSLSEARTLDENGTCPGEPVCKPGLIVPMWTPQGELGTSERVARAIVYLLAMFYLFVGVSIVSDRFMSSIEVIVSQERTVKVKKANGEVQMVQVKIWNETVSNLTLMALGSSAPEILLSIIEICGSGFHAGELGPSTIVGSAAFNLFIISSICIVAVDEPKKIRYLRVFFVTATWSVFAYLWLYFIISVISPKKVEVWEGLVTFAFFPITVISAYVVDRQIFFGRFLGKKVTMGRKTQKTQDDEEAEMAHLNNGAKAENGSVVLNVADMADIHKRQAEVIKILAELRAKNPGKTPAELQEMAEVEALKKLPKNRAYYRMQATRRFTGGPNIVSKAKVHEKHEREANEKKAADEEIFPEDDIQRVFFEPDFYAVMENVGTFAVTVSRMGPDLNNTVMVDYETADGTAHADNDYVPANGTLVFHADERHKQFKVDIIDDDVFEEDEYFYVRLNNVRVQHEKDKPKVKVELGLQQATVMILDDDHAGIYHFDDAEITVPESIGQAEFKVCRSSGARGKVTVPYRTRAGTAKPEEDYQEVAEGLLHFDDNETEQIIHINITNDQKYERAETFFIELGEPKRTSEDEEEATERKSPEKQLSAAQKEVADLGRPRLGETKTLTVTIRESEEFKVAIDRLMKAGNIAEMISTSSWKEQFVEAITVSAGDGDDDEAGEDGEETPPGCGDYVMHYITVFWKILFALVPPTDYCHGWLCFWFSLGGIGLMTALLGDIASSLGCTVGLKDAVTAVSLVALGTSLPDTFASKVAAQNDEYADAAIGNVTGSNAVNVFLGIGIAWTMAAIYWAAQGKEFDVEPGSLAFSVTTFCVFATLTLIILVIRRHPKVAGGELGGSGPVRYITSSILAMFWVLYLVLATLENYCVIAGF